MIDPADTNTNEFFRIKAIFDQVAGDPERSEIVKLQILMKKASDLYSWMQHLGLEVKTVKAFRYKTGGIEPIQEEMSVEEALKEGDRAFNIYYDFNTAKNNYYAVINAHKVRLNQYKVYEPFFDHVMRLIAVMKPQFEKLAKISQSDKEKQDMVRDMDLLRKEKMLADERIKELEKEIKEKEQAWELSTGEVFASIADNFEKWKFIASLPQWEELKPQDVGTISKIVSYCVIRNKNEITADEVVKQLNIRDVTALANLPFIKFVGKSKFEIDYDGLKKQLAENKKVDFRIDSKGWMVDVKNAVSRYIGKISSKIKGK